MSFPRRPTPATLLGLVLAAAACAPGDAPTAPSGPAVVPRASLTASGNAVVGNGTLRLGVDKEGFIGVQGTFAARPAFPLDSLGLVFLPTGTEGVAGVARPGSSSVLYGLEGWGAAAFYSPTEAARAEAAFNTLRSSDEVPERVSFTASDSSAISVVEIRPDRGPVAGQPFVRVTHDFHPTPATRNLYELAVTLENVSTTPILDLRYTRQLRWRIAGDRDIYLSYASMQGSATEPTVRRATNGGADFDPTGTARGGISVGGVRPEGDFTDVGPADHGAHLDLGLGALAPGERKTVYFYYGAAAGEPAALAAVGAVGARVYAFGQAAPDGTPVTFIMAYKAQSNASPVAVINGPFDVTLGTAVQLSAAGSSDPDGDALGYAWNFGDGTTGAGRDVSHTYTQPGAYTVTLAVTDAQGATAGATTTVVVRQPTAENRPPVAALTPSAASVAVGTPAVFTTGATDPDGDTPLACVIEAGDGSAPVTLSDCGAGLSHSYAQPGSYTVRLTARDPSGAAGAATAVVTVAAAEVNHAPEVYNLTVADGRGQPYAGPLSVATKSCRSVDGTSQYTTCVKFGFRDADGSADAPWAARVDWGDGTAWTPNSLPGQYASLLAPHDYAAPGTYTVRVRVTDRRGLTGEQTITLVVTAGTP